MRKECQPTVCDIEEASTFANKAIRNYAMGTNPIHIAVESTPMRMHFLIPINMLLKRSKLIEDVSKRHMKFLGKEQTLVFEMNGYVLQIPEWKKSTIRFTNTGEKIGLKSRILKKKNTSI